VCDGEIVSTEAATHIGQCSECSERLQQFVAMGAELRRTASLALAQTVKEQVWEKHLRVNSNLWQKGWETMRIPKFAFAMLLLIVLGLASSLVITKVRAHAEAPVMMLTIEPEGAPSQRCAVWTDPSKNWSCGGMESVSGGNLLFDIRVLATD